MFNFLQDDILSNYNFFQGINKETNQLDFEKEGEYFKDLVALLRTQSPKFDELIDKQVRYLINFTNSCTFVK